MKLSYAIAAIIANLLGLWAADYFLSNVSFSGVFLDLLITAVILSALNWLLKPLLKLLFGPVIVLTLGLALIVINVLILYLVDIFSKNLSIHGIVSLVYASLIVSLANIVIHALMRKPNH